MREIDKHGVRVDICPGCKGVWLDRGELEKILDMASGGYSEEPIREARRDDPPRRESDSRRQDYRDDDLRKSDEYDHRRPKRKESIFGEIFDIFG